MGDVEAGGCLPRLSPKGCGDGNGETRTTEEGPPVGAEGVGLDTSAARTAPKQGDGRAHEGTVPQSLSTHQCQIRASRWLSSTENEGARGGRVLCGGQPPRAGEGQGVLLHSISDGAMNLTFSSCLSHNLNALFKYPTYTDTTNPQP